MPQFHLFVYEPHISIPQVHCMHGVDRSRKTILVDYGFRLPSALDNRPLTFDEFEARLDQTIYVSATPSAYEIQRSGQVVDQIIRPPGLIDPELAVRRTDGQTDDVLHELRLRVGRRQ